MIMHLKDFSVTEEVHFQPKLIRFLTLDGRPYPAYSLLEMLECIPAPRWAVTNLPIWDYLVQQNIVIFDDDTMMVRPGKSFDSFKRKVEEFSIKHPSKPLKWVDTSLAQFQRAFPDTKYSNFDERQMRLL